MTFQDGSGAACVFTVGTAGGPACPESEPSAWIELDCPWTSVNLDMYERPLFTRELYIQSAYSYIAWNGWLQNGRVLEMAIDTSEGSTISGHYRAEFPAAAPFPALEARGSFRLCATVGHAADPCRQYQQP